jgi:hypothetical protein
VRKERAREKEKNLKISRRHERDEKGNTRKERGGREGKRERERERVARER